MIFDLYTLNIMTQLHNTSPNGQENPISQAERVISASLRPLPTETGDGTYVKNDKTTGLVRDLGNLDLKDVKTIAEVARSAVTGEPTNDREYILERVIQVCLFDAF